MKTSNIAYYSVTDASHSLRDDVRIFCDMAGRRAPILRQFIARDLKARYEGTFLGVIWALVIPLITLATYAFVFGYIFQARAAWTAHEGVPYAIVLFVGMLPYQLLADTLVTAPNQIRANPNFVTKVVFPLELLPASAVGVALVHALMTLGILIAAIVLAGVGLHWTLLLLPIAFLPLVMLTLGLNWFLAAVGTYYRDTADIAGVWVRIWFFASPIIYPVEALPDWMAKWFNLNPLTFIMDAFRRLMLSGELPRWGVWVPGTLFCAVVMGGGFLVFQRMRRGFASAL